MSSAAGPASPPTYQKPPWNRWEVLGVVAVGTFMAILDSSIVNIALPHIMTSLGVGLSEVEWILTAFMLTAAVAMPITGWLGNRIGYGRLYLAALALFTVGSALCALSWNIDSLIVARVIQAVGAGSMQPSGMAMITQVFDPHQRGRAIGLWGIGAMVAPTIGPTTGAYITQYFAWRSIFTINIPVGMVLLIIGLQVFGKREQTPRPPAFDWPGFSALAIFLVSFLLGLDRGQDHGWTSPSIVAYFAVAAAAFLFFITLELTTDHPVIPLQMFKHTDFSMGLLLSLIRAVSLFGAVFFLPVFLQRLMGLSTIQNGVILIPGALSVAFFMPLAGRITDQYGARWPAVIGILLTGLSLYFYRRLDVDSSYWDVIYPQLFRGAGLAFMLTPVATAAMNAVPPHQTGTASGLLNIGQQAGGSFGIALLSTILSHRAVRHAELIGGNPLLAQALANPTLIPDASPESAQAALFYVASRAAQVRAFDDVFAIAAGITICGLLPALLLSAQPPPRRGPGPAAE